MTASKDTLNRMAAEIFELYQLIAIARSRVPAGPDDLSETEFLTLDALSKVDMLTIGEIQRLVGVVPAQMSRVIRALEESGGRGYVECRINPHDRRRVDVSLTEPGRMAHDKYRSARLGTMYALLSVLSPSDREHFMRIMRLMRESLEQKVQ